MIKELKVPLSDLIFCLSDAIDLISPFIANHHKRVAYIALNIALELNLSISERSQLVLAGLLHDCGCLNLKSRLEALEFELISPHQHALLGYRLLNKFPPLAEIAPLVLYHHLPWVEYERSPVKEQLPWLSQLLHLADRFDVLTAKPHPLPPKQVLEKIVQHKSVFLPGAVAALEQLMKKEYFWLDLASPTLDSLLREQTGITTVELDLDSLLSFAKLFAQLVDFRNRFTATHSSGVAACAEILGRLSGFSARELQMLRVAGYFHDVGKIMVPDTIINKPERLTETEFATIKSHPYYTYRLLHPIAELETITAWAAFHHECLDGNGYPFHLAGADITLGSRIVAVADVFTALTEERPYRAGMSKEQLTQVLHTFARKKALDPNLVGLAIEHFAEINNVRKLSQRQAADEYNDFMLAAELDFGKHPFAS